MDIVWRNSLKPSPIQYSVASAVSHAGCADDLAAARQAEECASTDTFVAGWESGSVDNSNADGRGRQHQEEP
jgi:hypothetical protein